MRTNKHVKCVEFGLRDHVGVDRLVQRSHHRMHIHPFGAIQLSACLEDLKCVKDDVAAAYIHV